MAAVREGETGQRGIVHAGTVPRRGRNDAGGILDHARVDKVLVQVVDVLRDSAVDTPGIREVVNDREVLK